MSDSAPDRSTRDDDPAAPRVKHWWLVIAAALVTCIAALLIGWPMVGRALS